ncbi:PaaI family thioesterase [Rhizobium lusitanum]|nr:PaaI family thioesterase [Rhizobium lusitanum]
MNDRDGWIAMDDDGFIGLVGPIYHWPFDGGETSRFRFFPESKHRNRMDVVHGGMLMTFADRSLGFTARRGNLQRRQATVQLDVHFVKSVAVGQVVDFEGRIVSETRTLVFVDGTMTVGGNTVLTARGVWRVWSEAASV